jgi:acyl-CoA thioesterase
MSPRESLREILVVQPDASPGRYQVALESFWGNPILGDLLARFALVADAFGERAPLTALHAVFTDALPAGERLDLDVMRRDAALVFDVGQGGKSRCSAIARFDKITGPSYVAPPPPATPDPNGLPSTVQAARAEGWPEEYARGPFEFRRVGPRIGVEGGSHPQLTWIRPRETLPTAAAWHTAALLFASEFYSHWAFEWRLGTGIDYDAHRLLDHSVWLHGAPRFDDWILLAVQSCRAANGIAMAHRQIYARDGTLIATVAHSAQVSMAKPS